MKQNHRVSWLKALLLTLLSAAVAYPLLRLLLHIRPAHIREVLSAELFFPMLKNSLLTTLIATGLSVVLAFLLAFGLCRSHVKFKPMWVMLFTVPMLIPSISHGMGLVLLLGDNGVLTKLLGINIGLYGYPGIVMGSVLYSFPVAFLLFYDSLQYEDFTLYESARVLGFGSWKQFLTITLPAVRPAGVAAGISVFAMVFTDYGVPLITGGTVMTLPVYMYREVIGMMNFSGGTVVGVILLTPAVLAFLLDVRRSSADRGSSTVVKPYEIQADPRRDRWVFIGFTVILVVLCLPILAFACLTFVRQFPVDPTFTTAHVRKLISGGIGMYLLNSLAVAMATALLGTVLAYCSAYLTARTARTASTKLLHMLSLLPLAIPGIVLGLSYVISFHQLPFYTTIAILIAVNITHFFSSPYLLAYNSLIKFNPNLEDVAASLKIPPLRMMTAVYVPSTVLTVVEMYSYFFVNSMITISAVSFLANFRTSTLALMIPQLEAQSFIEGTAFVSLLILALNLLEKGIAYAIKRRLLNQPIRP